MDVEKDVSKFFFENMPFAKMAGYRFARDMVTIFLQDSMTTSSIGIIYDDLYEKYKTSKENIESRLRSYMTKAWQYLPAVFKHRPTNWEFIVRLAEYVQGLTFRKEAVS